MLNTRWRRGGEQICPTMELINQVLGLRKKINEDISTGSTTPLETSKFGVYSNIICLLSVVSEIEKSDFWVPIWSYSAFISKYFLRFTFFYLWIDYERNWHKLRLKLWSAKPKTSPYSTNPHWRGSLCYCPQILTNVVLATEREFLE